MLWVEVSNRGLGWSEPAAAAADLAELLAGRLDAAVHAVLCQDLATLRGSYAAAALGRETATAAASQWLGAVTLRAAARGRRAGFDLPAMRAARRTTKLPVALDEILSTALVALHSGANPAHLVHRCHGLLRADGAPVGFDPQDDAAFADEAGLSVFLARGWAQCPKLVHGPRAGHYCGKTCSNAAFAARKGARDPGYFAAKQAQYRDRQRRREALRPAARAFSFVD